MRTALKATLVLGTICTTLIMGGFAALALWMIFAASAAAQLPDIHKDIVYSKVDNTELKLDLVQPPKGDGPFPLIIWIHGGAWQFGDRKEYHDAMTNLAKVGYVGAAIVSMVEFLNEHLMKK
ncbi:MAG TPA: hypothetical protein DDY78_23770 [Planctomycetales bacterium]|nr:hypothetical protein [Planctomycetales bacterium]